MNKFDIYLRKKLKAIVPSTGTDTNKAAVCAIQKNIEELGFSFDKTLALTLAGQSKDFLAKFYQDLIPTLKEMVGAHVAFCPMYPNFPRQVMEMSECDLYWNALYHYLTLENPNREAEEARLPLSEKTDVRIISLGSEEDFLNIFTQLAASNSSLSESDKEILEWMLSNLKNLESLLPSEIPQRETRAIIIADLIQKDPVQELAGVTATDVLRIATQISGGDISLAAKTRYKNMPRALRRALLGALENCNNSLEEDMLRHKSKWIRLGEILHPGQYAERFPRAFAAISKLRKNQPIATFASKTEAALKSNDWAKALELLKTRPGEFLRRLDVMLRRNPTASVEILNALASVGKDMATPALLNVHQHFHNRKAKAETRCVFPKGTTSKMKVIPAVKETIATDVCEAVAANVETILRERFSKLEPLGKVFIDKNLAFYPIPFAQRSASKALRSLPRGSHAPLDTIKGKPETLRFFIWWKNADTGSEWDDRVDLDLSCQFLKSNFEENGTVSYYNLRAIGGRHSGDITDAPNGAAEFIDLNIPKLIEKGTRYVAAIVTSYTKQPYKDLPECFMGWMTRHHDQEGQIFEPKTVKHKSDLTGDTKMVIPVLIDLKTRKAIWLDISVGEQARWAINVENNKTSIALVCKNLASLKKPSLHTLVRLHAEARGEVVATREEADVVFRQDFAYENDKIASEFLK